MLIERKELTSGSTWHAAGLLPLFNLCYSVGQIAQIFGRALRQAQRRDRPRRRLPAGLQHPPRPHAGPARRIQILRRRGGDHRRHRGQVPHAGRGQGDLAAVQYRRPDRRDPAPAGRLHSARRSDAGVRARRARARRRDQSQHHRHRDRAAQGRRLESRHRQGRNRLRARDFGDRQFRAPDRADGRDSTCPSFRSSTSISSPRRSRRSGRGAQGPAGNGRAARVGFRPGTCARRRAGCCSGPTRSARRPAMSTGRRRTANTSCFRKIWNAWAVYRDGDRARAGVRRGRHQEGLQRRHRLYAGRLADRRPGAGIAQFLAQRRAFVRRHRGRRGRLAACRMDRRGRAQRRHARRRSAPLRPLCATGLSD